MEMCGIIKVDKDGIITYDPFNSEVKAVKAGTVKLTFSSVSNPNVSASIHIAVEGTADAADKVFSDVPYNPGDGNMIR